MLMHTFTTIYCIYSVCLCVCVCCSMYLLNVYVCGQNVEIEWHIAYIEWYSYIYEDKY